MNAGLKLEEMGVDKPPNESRAKLSDLQPAELGGDRQQLNIVAGQPCGGRLLLLGEIPVLSGDGWAALGAHIRMGSRSLLDVIVSQAHRAQRAPGRVSNTRPRMTCPRNLVGGRGDRFPNSISANGSRPPGPKEPAA